MIWYKKIGFILIPAIFLSFQGNAQSGLLDKQALLPVVRQALSMTYNFKFDLARENLKVIRKEIPDHPATTFLEALILYWENYPLTINNPEASRFLNLMEETSTKAEKMVENNRDDSEGLFFALFSRAFIIMYWSDNGKASKAFSYLNHMYNQMLKGMEKKDEFTEFYFSSGLYNYYIEAYPDKHPVFKPVKILFKSGNKAQGLRELEYCAANSVYLRVESKYFLSLIYSSYENNIRKASEYAASLYREFPNNPCYSGNYAETLLFDKKYQMAEVVLANLSRIKSPFAGLQTHVLNGYLLDKYYNDQEAAFHEFNKGLRLTDQFGEMASRYKVIAWMGLGRYYRKQGNSEEASKYFKMARNESSYEYLVEDK